VTRLEELPVRSAADIVAFSSVVLTNVVVSAEPFHEMTEVETKPDPVRSRVVSPAPAVTLVGLTVVIVGAGLFTEKLAKEEVPPPGGELTTVTFAVAALAKLFAGTVAVRLVVES
jgi:hypothetical protein